MDQAASALPVSRPVKATPGATPVRPAVADPGSETVPQHRPGLASL